MKLELQADRVKIYGPKVDGGYTLTFDVGEYEVEKVAKLFLIKQGEIVNLTIGQNTENSD